MTKENKKINKVGDLTIDTIAERWVNLVLSQIEAKKQRINTPGKKYREGAN